MVKIHGPFYVSNRWKWITFSCSEANTHAAMLDQAKAIGATAWDTSQASVMINGSVVQGHPTVFI